MSFKKELKAFLLRGSLIDMAVGIVIGAAFGKIVNSFVKDVLMPPITLLTKKESFDSLKIVLRHAVTEGEKIITPEVTLNYGTFIQTILDFIIIGISVFFLVKAINRLHRKKEEEVAPAAPTKEETLLTEIRDLLKVNASK